MVDKKLEGIQLIVRAIAIASGIIVLGIIVDKVKSSSSCGFQSNGTQTCDFGIGMGAISLVVGLLLSVPNVLALVLPAPIALIALPGGRRGKMALVDTGLSVVIAILWLACAIYTSVKYEEGAAQFSEATGGVVFEFVSVIAWVVAGIFGIIIYKKSDTILPGPN